jgi:hypothetical protein
VIYFHIIYLNFENKFNERRIRDIIIAGVSMGKYLNLFNQIALIMHHDYAGCFDKKDLDQSLYYRGLIKPFSLYNDRQFFALVSEYLRSFKDHHLSFHMMGYRIFFGLEVRRLNDLLYVTNSMIENVKIGDYIYQLDEDSIMEARTKWDRLFIENIDEREVVDWDLVFNKYKIAHIRNSLGEEYQIALNILFPSGYFEGDNSYTSKRIDEKTLLIKLPDFNEGRNMEAFISSNEVNNFKGIDHLIIDVRRNQGGSDLVYYPLLKYVFPEGVLIKDNLPSETVKINYTTRNCDTRIKLFKELLPKVNSARVREYLMQEMKILRQSKGKGFVEMRDNIDDLGINDLRGSAEVKKVIVLTDTYCGSSGDAFVQTCKLSSKVKIVGRPTLGSTDYSNVTFVDLDNFSISYPISRTDAIDKKMGLNFKGVAVDEYIRWSPEHFNRDLDLEAALKILKNK